MASKLTQITNGYHTFVENQVLTHSQLNEFVSYLDDQDRLSRVFLQGVGVVCGFELIVSAAKITLSQGVGLTTDGDLIQFGQDVLDSADVFGPFSSDSGEELVPLDLPDHLI